MVATSSKVVSAPPLKGVAQQDDEKAPNDDGTNVWFDGDYRMQIWQRFFYQAKSSNPITDPWLDGGEAFEGMAKGPIKLEGLQSGAPLMYSTYYHGEIAELPSRMDIVKLGSSAPAYMWPDQSGSDLAGDIYETVLSNLGNEKPWCIDSHIYHDASAVRLWMGAGTRCGSP